MSVLPISSSSTPSTGSRNKYILILLVLAGIAFCITVVSNLSFFYIQNRYQSFSSSNPSDVLLSTMTTSSSSSTSARTRGLFESAQDYIQYGSLVYDIPPDLHTPPNIPSPPLRQEDWEHNEKVARRKKVREELGYGGNNDHLHLGGFTNLDSEGVSPMVWKNMLEFIGVKSLIDVGCGRGISTLWFHLQGVDTFCVEGSHDAVQQNIFSRTLLLAEKNRTTNAFTPTKASVQDPSSDEWDTNTVHSRVVEHDFSKGPWWSNRTVDAIWCVEFLEHVGRQYMYNYIVTFKKAALIFATHSLWGGWHHVEVHEDDWWIGRFQALGFQYSKELTEKYRALAKEERNQGIPNPMNPPKPYSANHIVMSMMVFINPIVAAKKEHQHLFSEGGCFDDYNQPTFHCGDKALDERTHIPPEWKPIPFKEEKEQEWVNIVVSSLKK